MKKLLALLLAVMMIAGVVRRLWPAHEYSDGNARCNTDGTTLYPRRNSRPH